jgi:hypothetical protein
VRAGECVHRGLGVDVLRRGEGMVCCRRRSRIRRRWERALRLALACYYPDPRERLSIPDAVQVLAGEVEAPKPPLVKPAFVWPAGRQTATGGRRWRWRPSGCSSQHGGTFSSAP